MLLNLEYLEEVYDLDIKGVVHIGGHHGEEFSSYNDLGIEELAFFEPLVSNFKVLQGNVPETDKIKLFNFALGNSNKEVEMFVEEANAGQSSSVLKPDKHLQQYPHIQFEKKEQVPMRRLDDLEDDFDPSLYNMVNIDVQGYELEVFKGAKRFLKGVDYIITEVNRDELYENCAKIEDLDLYLGALGFERIETDWAGGTWGDAFYMREEE